MDKEWNLLLEKAKKNLSNQETTSFINTGNYSCALMTDKGNVYTGTNIYSTTIRLSAEQSAITAMLNNGEKRITRLLVINELEEIISPLVDTFLYLTELELDLNNILTINKKKEIRMIELIPDYYGTFRIAR